MSKQKLDANVRKHLVTMLNGYIREIEVVKDAIERLRVDLEQAENTWINMETSINDLTEILDLPPYKPAPRGPLT